VPGSTAPLTVSTAALLVMLPPALETATVKMVPLFADVVAAVV